MEVFLDIVRQFDYSILVMISDHLRGGLSDTVWTVITSLGNGGALWIVAALVLLFFRKTRRAGAAMLVALLIGLLVGNVLLKEWVIAPRGLLLTHADLIALARSAGSVVFPIRAYAVLLCCGDRALLFPPQIRSAGLPRCGIDRFFAPVCLRALSDRRARRDADRYPVRSCCRLDHRPRD